MSTKFNYEKLRKPHKTIWIQKCRVCTATTVRGFYCPLHRKKGSMNKWEWYLKYGLDREMRQFKPSSLRDTRASHSQPVPEQTESS